MHCECIDYIFANMRTQDCPMRDDAREFYQHFALMTIENDESEVQFVDDTFYSEAAEGVRDPFRSPTFVSGE